VSGGWRFVLVLGEVETEKRKDIAYYIRKSAWFMSRKENMERIQREVFPLMPWYYALN
jgi:hypothetical protein